MRNIALVLSSGGARGCAHIGVIKVLEKNGFKITSVAGTSMGALVGGIYSTGQLSAFEEWISTIDMMEVLRLTDFSISSKGLVILKGTEVVFSEGNLFEAIRASISIPNVFQPHRIGDMYLVDGGLLNPIPVNRVKRSGEDILVVVNVSAPIPWEHRDEEKELHSEHRYSEQIKAIREKLGNYFPFMDHDDDDENEEIDGIGIFNLSSKSIGTMMRKIAELTLEKHQPDILINLPKESYGTYDFYKAKEIIEEGEEAALDALRLSGYIT
jgi:NTE family protein